MSEPSSSCSCIVLQVLLDWHLGTLLPSVQRLLLICSSKLIGAISGWNCAAKFMQCSFMAKFIHVSSSGELQKSGSCIWSPFCCTVTGSSAVFIYLSYLSCYLSYTDTCTKYGTLTASAQFVFCGSAGTGGVSFSGAWTESQGSIGSVWA